MKVAKRADRWKEERPWARIAKLKRAMLCLNSDRKNAPSIYVHMIWFYFNPVSKASKICCQTVFSAVEPRVIFCINELLSVTDKVVLPASQKSNVIYQFACHGDSRDIGRTSQWLQNRIKPHVPKSIRSCFSSQKRLFPARRCKSSTQTNIQSSAFYLAIGLHHLQNPVCAQQYDDSRFAILAQGRPPLHQSALQVTFIKTSNRSLLTNRICVQLNDCV